MSGQETAKSYSGEINFRIVEKQSEYVIGKMPVADGIRNPLGLVHAGALLWFADVVATVLAMTRADMENGRGFPLAVNLNASLLGNQKDGELTAEARFVRSGRRITVVRTKVTGAEDRLLADVTTTHVPAQ